MQKVILISILLANVIIPLRAAWERSARRGLKKALFFMLVFEAAYVAAVVLVYPRL
jgi:hypothetical protein